MHRVSINKGVNKKAFIASYYNSVSLAFTEICGRSHGGGVLELMPSEVEEVVIPNKETNEDLLPTIDEMLRKNKDISEILEHSNKTILKKNYGFTPKDIALANSIWEKLSNRRLKRGGK